MDRASESESRVSCGHYDANYGNFHTELYKQIRHEAFGEDIGQNSWHTADEQDRFLAWLQLSAGKRMLDVACGAGGPALRIAASSGCSVMGVDLHGQAILNACTLANERGLGDRANFQVVDASQQLPFVDASFDAITCIDAVNHLADRPGVFAHWARLLKPGGRLLFTDPIVVTGPLTNAEIAVRSSAGLYLFVPVGYNDRIIEQCGLRLSLVENVSRNMAEIAERRMTARASRSQALRDMEGDQTYAAQQEFLTVAARVAREGRLSRFVYVAEKIISS